MTDTTAVSDLQRETDAFRQRLIRMDRQASQVLSATYADTLKALQPRLDALEAQIAARIKAGEEVGQAWLFQQDRYRELIRQTNVLMTQYGATVQAVTTATQQAAVRGSLVEAGRQLAAVSGGSDVATLAAGWASIPDASIVNMVASLQQSTPLGQLFADFGKDAVRDTNKALLRGLALGLGGSEIARDVQLALGITRARAETITRTEVMRASRASLSAAFENSGVVKSLRWSAALSSRSCIYCLSRHGSIWPLGTVMPTHQNCRCSWSPVIDDSEPWESGDSWLRAQPATVQRSVLGIAAQQAFAAGDVLLSDFQKTGFDDAWGPWGQVGSFQWALRQAARR